MNPRQVCVHANQKDNSAKDRYKPCTDTPYDDGDITVMGHS